MLLAVFLSYLSLSLAIPLQGQKGLRIIGGQEANAAQFPYLAALTIRTDDGQYFCGGALINTLWLATTAHCINGATSITIKLGSRSLNDADPNRITLATDTFVLHPNFNPETLESDIGLVKFHMPITYNDYIRPINMLPSTKLSDGSPLVTAGWGQLSDEGAGVQDKLSYVSVTTIPNSECKFFYGSQLLDTMVCATGNYNEGICYGDTGGPLIQYVSRGMVMLVGISSFFSGNGCETIEPSGFTRVFDYADWIRNETGFR